MQQGAGSRRKLETRLAAVEADIARAVDMVLRGVVTEGEAAVRLAGATG